MAFDRFLIGPVSVGLQTDLKPFMVADEALVELNNAYVFRGRIRKRFGSRLMGIDQRSSRLRVALTQTPIALAGGAGIGITDGVGNAAGTVPGATFAVGQGFSIGNALYIVTNGTGGAQPMFQSIATTTATYNVTNGAYNFVGAPINTQIYFYNNIPVTITAGAASGTVPGNIFSVGQMFSIGDGLFTVTNGAPGLQNMLKTDATVTAQYNTANGAFNFAGSPAANGTPVYFYPGLPVMGLTQYEIGAVNNHPSYGFDTQFAYVFIGASWQRSFSGPGPIWHGNDTDFFWVSNWEGIADNTVSMFVSNFHVTNLNGAVAATDDPLWTFDGTTWSTFTPQFLTAGDKVKTARIVIPFRNRLVLLNTVELDAAGANNLNYPNRCRFSQNGSPFEGGLPNCATAWLEQTQAGSHQAGFIDATTEEAIISAEFIKDRLIVYFERSTWELAYTGNEIQPFIWQKLNTELGSESTFSTIPFDKNILTVGETGLHSCNGSNVERIDQIIPDQIFKISNRNEAESRVAGIRDYYTEMVYWAYPNAAQAGQQVFPNKILVYNYKNGAWATNDDCITAFGYFEQQTGLTWAQANFTWASTNATWSSGTIAANFRQILAGNQQGFVFVIEPDVGSNASVMQITDMAQVGPDIVLTIFNHTLMTNDFIAISGAVGPVLSGIFKVTYLTANTVSIRATLSAPYQGGATIARVSRIDILTKEWNFYQNMGKNVYIQKIDFNVTKTTAGEITVDYYPSSTQESMITQANDTGGAMGTSVLETSPYALVPLEQQQNQLWHPVFFQADGETVQLRIYLNDNQMVVPNISQSNFELNAMLLYAQQISRLQ